MARIHPFYTARPHSGHRWDECGFVQYNKRWPQEALDYGGMEFSTSWRSLRSSHNIQPVRSCPLLILINKWDLKDEVPEFLSAEKLRRDLDLNALEEQGYKFRVVRR